MKKVNTGKTKLIWMAVLSLAICIISSVTIIADRLNTFIIDDSGAISLITEKTQSMGEVNFQTPEADQKPVQESTTKEPQTQTPPPGTPAATATPRNPGFEVGDDKTVWSTDTQVEIFRVSYENGEQVVTVQSGNGQKVIAPGTQNSYTFKLKNTGNVALDYDVEIDAFFSHNDIQIPITGRLNRYDGKWVVGGKDTYVDVSALNLAYDKDTLAAGKYTYYTLDWLWPFESGNDELDTEIGNLAAEEDLVFTIVIKTTATENLDDEGGGITPPTGDDTNLSFWIILAAASFVLMLLLVIIQKKKQKDNAEEELVESDS